MDWAPTIAHTLSRSERLKGILKTIAGVLPRPLRKQIEYYRMAAHVRSGLKLVNEEALLREYRRAVNYLIERVGRDAIGDYLEFGVFYGSSLSCMHQVLSATRLDSVRLFGFDAFEGLPESEYADDALWQAGWFRSSYEFARDYLTDQGVEWNRTYLIKGWYRDTLTQETTERYKIEKASIIMIDCDLYMSAQQALTFCGPLIQDEAIIFFDDWNAGHLAEEDLGEKHAFKEFLEENPQFHAEAFGSYTYQGEPNARIFRVINTDATASPSRGQE